MNAMNARTDNDTVSTQVEQMHRERYPDGCPNGCEACTKRLTREFLAAPMVEWSARADNMSPGVRMSVEGRIAMEAVYLARASAYLSRRASGGRHIDALARQNGVAAKVRAALGYTLKVDRITF